MIIYWRNLSVMCVFNLTAGIAERAQRSRRQIHRARRVAGSIHCDPRMLELGLSVFVHAIWIFANPRRYKDTFFNVRVVSFLQFEIQINL